MSGEKKKEILAHDILMRNKGVELNFKVFLQVV